MSLRMRHLAVDHGTRRIGLAASDESGVVARPLGVIRHVSRAQDAERVAASAAELGAVVIIVGLPRDSMGDIGPQARHVLRFVEALEKVTPLPVRLWDESYSTATARSIRRRGGRGQPLDALAAAALLQDFLDAGGPGESLAAARGAPPA
ncbi:MAG: Holliday junction resolvase RuvX [Anaerolineales bacterium]